MRVFVGGDFFGFALQDIMASLMELTKESTALLIAHRLSTTKNADRILVLNHGV